MELHTVQSFVDAYFKQYGWNMNSQIVNEQDGFILTYEVPKYCLENKSHEYKLCFYIPHTNEGDGIKVRLTSDGITKGDVFIEFVEITSFLESNLKLSSATSQSPIEKELLELNRKLDRLLEMITTMITH